jgi:ubiquinone/menaquinone biosynthesis C-methylase UbiE
LDVACGRGAVLFPAAEAVGPNGFVNAIDLAKGMVEQTSREAANRGLAHVEVQQMDAEHLDFADATFDAVLCGFAIFFFPQLDRALREFRRTLKPGAQIAVSTWGNKFDQQWEWYDQLIEKYLPPEEQKKPDPSNEPHFDTPEGMQKILTDAGFAETRVISETADFIYATKDEWWQSLWSHGGRRRLERIERTGGSDMLERFKAECLGQLGSESEDVHRSFQVLYTLAKRP